MWWMLASAAVDVVGQDQDQGKQVYQDATSYVTAQHKNLQSMDNAQSTAAAIARDKALTSVAINSQQRVVEAEAQVGAAFAGIDGGAVDNVIRMTKTNAAYEQGASDIQATSAFNAATEDVFSAAYTYHSTRYEPPQSVIAQVMDGVLSLYNPLDGEAWADSLAWM